MDKASFFAAIKNCSWAFVSVSDMVDGDRYYIVAEMKSVWYKKEILVIGDEYADELSEEQMTEAYAKTIAGWFIKQLYKRQQWRSNFGIKKGWVTVG